MDGDVDVKGILKNWRYNRRLLEALLVSSESEKNSTLPTMKEFILSEVVRGTIEYVGGNSETINFLESNYGRHDFLFNHFRHLKSEIAEPSRRKLHPKIEKSILKLCEYQRENPGGSAGPYGLCELYIHFNHNKTGICPVRRGPTFSLPREILKKVQKDILPSLSKEERTDIEGIGKAMRTYINDDLEFIKRVYWF